MNEAATPLPLHQTAFPDYDPATLPAIPAHWTDISWHNDSCPSWSACDDKVSIFIDYLDPEEREVPEFPRFTIYHSDLDDNVLRSDDWAEVLAKVAEIEADMAKEAPVHQITAATKIIVTVPGDEARQIEPVEDRATLAEFFHENIDGIDTDEQALIREALAKGDSYVGGGGAAVLWTVVLDLPKPPPRFPNLARDLPDFDQSEIPADLPAEFTEVDRHYDNARFESREGITIEISEVDRAKRSMGADWVRFNVLRSPNAEEIALYGEPGDPDRHGGAEDEPVIGTESWEEALAAIRPLLDERKVAAMPIPRKPEDEDWSLDEAAGFEAFTLDKGFDTDAPDDWKLGWHTAWTRAYGQGVKCAAAYDADAGADPDEATNPYPQFSAAGEAWASGFDDFEAL